MMTENKETMAVEHLFAGRGETGAIGDHTLGRNLVRTALLRASIDLKQTHSLCYLKFSS